MSGGIWGTIKFKCSRCGEQHSLASKEFKFEPVGETDRQMGMETEYVAEIDLLCNSCQQPINLRIDVWEYPSGAINHVDHSGSGLSELEYQFDVSSKTNDSENQNRLVGVAAGGAILGASLGGPPGAIIGGILGLFLGDSANKSKKGGA